LASILTTISIWLDHLKGSVDVIRGGLERIKYSACEINRAIGSA
jgi:hypothetical protein